LASGQAFAAVYYSLSDIADADLADGTKWSSACGGSAGTGTITLTNSDIAFICSGHSLNLSGNVVLNLYRLIFDSGTPAGTWGGSGLQFGAGSNRIVNTNSSLPTIALNLSSMSSGNTILITGGGSNSPVTFSSVTPTNKGLRCGGVDYTPGNSIAAGITCTVVNVTPPPPPPPPAVSAPIFSTKEKPAVFSEEVK